MITIITFGTLASSLIIAIQKRGRQMDRLNPRIVCLMKFIASIILEDIPKHLIEMHEVFKHIPFQKKGSQRESWANNEHFYRKVRKK